MGFGRGRLGVRGGIRWRTRLGRRRRGGGGCRGGLWMAVGGDGVLVRGRKKGGYRGEGDVGGM